MAIRWSRKAKRFYDDQTGYPVLRSRGLKSSIARADYRRARSKRKPKVKRTRKADVRATRKRATEIPEGYRVRALSEEFAEELTQFDGTLDKDMDFDDYMDFLDGDQGDVMDSEDSYSED